MFTVERHPSSILAEGVEATTVETRPNLVNRLTADKALQPLGVCGKGILAVLQDGNAIVEAFLQLGA